MRTDRGQRADAPPYTLRRAHDPPSPRWACPQSAGPLPRRARWCSASGGCGSDDRTRRTRRRAPSPTAPAGQSLPAGRPDCSDDLAGRSATIPPGYAGCADADRSTSELDALSMLLRSAHRPLRRPFYGVAGGTVHEATAPLERTTGVPRCGAPVPRLTRPAAAHLPPRPSTTTDDCSGDTRRGQIVLSDLSLPRLLSWFRPGRPPARHPQANFNPRPGPTFNSPARQPGRPSARSSTRSSGRSTPPRGTARSRSSPGTS